jgi:putative SOS response-associated peptidase YedK
MATMRWGLFPFRDKPATSKLAPDNARSEDAFAKPVFRPEIRKRRCLIPADGFHEWQRPAGDLQQPFDIYLKKGYPLFFAGVYDIATGSRPGRTPAESSAGR